ncbi:two-component sensor protein RcsC [Klebsiella pneumoniae]|uniref:Two-component sensor protein RcsC n=1 Tax=Klebsiella pneumoniae TaxID=573 RepID=A0A377XQY8_KLEPN|nr:two-component sensor protein RcsC [Klebsiella pneumoniae]
MLRSPSAENSPALMAPEAQAGNNDDMMILVVDDHPINRRLLADQLGSLGYQWRDPRTTGSTRSTSSASSTSISCSATSTCLIWMAIA